MKIIQLNVWGGKVYEPLLAFFREHAKDTDVFCLQEVTDADIELKSVPYKWMENMRTTRKAIQEILHDFVGYYAPSIKGIGVDGKPVPHNFSFGNAVFVRKGIIIKSYSESFIHGHFNMPVPGDNPDSGNLIQVVALEKDGKHLTVAGLHGLSRVAPKEDIPERIAQSHKIREALRTVQGDLVICGDFNLDPDTESLKIIKEGYRDLITEFNIQSTRTHYYPKEYKQWADYMFTTKTLKIKHFEVMPDVVSDHSPLLLITD